MSANLHKKRAKWSEKDLPAPSTRTWIRRLYRRKVRPAGREILVRLRMLVPGARMLPSFLIIGAQRAGTTSLYSYLLQHPNVLPALAKEVGYFDSHYLTRPFKWYEAHFAHIQDGSARRPITGEASPHYMYRPEVPGRVLSRLPEVKLIVLLRDPVARAYSHYRLAVEFGIEKLSFEDALRAEPERLGGAIRGRRWSGGTTIQRLGYVERGIYHEHLSRWLSWFPRNSLLAVETERLNEDVPRTTQEVFDYLELEPFDVGRVARLNVLPPSSIPANVEEELREFYRPHNQRLCELLGQSFRWAE